MRRFVASHGPDDGCAPIMGIVEYPRKAKKRRSAMLPGILQHTPAWIWVMLAALIALGISQAAPRRMTPRRATTVPLAMAVLSFLGVVSAFSRQPLALVAWAAGMAAALVLARAAGTWETIRWSTADRCLHVPGSWIPLLLILCMFATRFCVSVAQAVNPGLLRHGTFAMAAGFIYGAVSGIFLARSLVAWRVSRQAPLRGVIT
ncbi:hypothetical protein P3W85_08185 [Cupriavidus basilensis]|uniref:DUF1453 domain-containing protein n=1 Tax=Cupriavidus basilensis TaxID=68895 RepID=A0ABT6AJZ3_9BURK|nr:DUF6622 family protein [Cupriavidus basilensis]MDF3832925.1 hypothetical protein [Cupriavidus basilensis]